VSDDLVDLIAGRTSPARLRGPGPTPEERDRILAAGLRAPDHGLLRPWRFLVIEGEGRQRLGEHLATSLASRNPGATAQALDAERAKAMRAPLVIVVAAVPRETQRIPEIEQVVSAGAAAQNMMLAAHALGYGALWRTGAAAYDPALVTALGLEAGARLVALLHIGTIETPGKPKVADPAGVVQDWPPEAAR
jgi:nitroreductase